MKVAHAVIKRSNEMCNYYGFILVYSLVVSTILLVANYNKMLRDGVSSIVYGLLLCRLPLYPQLPVQPFSLPSFRFCPRLKAVMPRS